MYLVFENQQLVEKCWNAETFYSTGTEYLMNNKNAILILLDNDDKIYIIFGNIRNLDDSIHVSFKYSSINNEITYFTLTEGYNKDYRNPQVIHEAINEILVENNFCYPYYCSLYDIAVIMQELSRRLYIENDEICTL